MPKAHTNARSVSRQILSDAEMERLARKLSVSLENDHDNISILLLLLDQLERTRGDVVVFSNVMMTLKQRLYIGTSDADSAQERFTDEAYANRGKLLLFPSEG